MDTRMAIMDFAKGIGHKIIGSLNLLPESSDMKNGWFYWYKDDAGATYMILPESQYIVIVANGMAIRSMGKCCPTRIKEERR